LVKRGRCNRRRAVADVVHDLESDAEPETLPEDAAQLGDVVDEEDSYGHRSEITNASHLPIPVDL
jgi:hypothetical protein